MHATLGVLALLALQAAPQDELVLVADGRSAYEIVLREPALPPARTAVRELVEFLERATGARLPVVAAPTPGKPHFFVGGPVEVKPEGFRLWVADGDLHLAGDDSPGKPEEIRRNRPVRCGTLFGAYEFLERFAGVTFVWPDELGTIVPARKEIRVPRALDLIQAPDWTTRTIINTPPGSTGGLFGRRLRLGASVETDYTHNWSRILPAEKYGAAHPEYFALVRGERRAAYYLKNHGGQVCTSNSEVIDIFARAAIEAFDQNPADRVFPISPNDGKGFCECGPCRAIEPMSDRLLTFYNAVAERVAKVHPTKRLGAFVYAQYRHAPARVRPHPNLELAHATNSAHAQGMGWAREREDERAWTSFGVPVVKYDIYYYGDYGSLNLPAPVTVHLAEKVRAEHAAGFCGGYLYAAPSWELLGAGHVVMARLMWDRNADVGAIEKRTYDALYGPAGADVLEYYRLLEARLRKARLEGIERSEPIVRRALGWAGEDEMSAAFTIAAYVPVLDSAAALLERARGRGLSDLERRRLARLQDHHMLLEGTVRGMVAAGRLEGAETSSAEDRERFRAALELRESARARLRAYAPEWEACLDEGRLEMLSSRGALARLAREPGSAVSAAEEGFEDGLSRALQVATSGGAAIEASSDRPWAGQRSLKVAVPAGGEASFALDLDVRPGALVRLSLAHRFSGARARYDHTREAPVIRLQERGAKGAAALPRLGVPAVEDAAEWNVHRFVFQIPAGVSRLRATFSFPLPGEFGLDEIRLDDLR